MMKFFLHFGNNLRKYVFCNFKSKCQDNFRMEILRKHGVNFFLPFENTLRKKGFKNFEKIYMYSEILQKLMKNFETKYSVEIIAVIF